MSAAIRTSLNKLHTAVQKLEQAVETKKAQVAAAPKKGNQNQADLFGAMTAGQSASNFNAVNVRMLATRLDTAINQVEQILKEGRG